MRILVVAYGFPPFNSPGGVRVGKTVMHLFQAGHEVKVISARNQPLERTLPLEIPYENVNYTRWLNVNWLAEQALGGRRNIEKHGYTPRGPLRNLLTWGKSLYASVVNLPDSKVGWYPYAVYNGWKLIRHWRPDVILASGLPATTLLIGATLSRWYGIPWVAELRDLWIGNHYRDEVLPEWRSRLEDWMEQKVLGSARGLITVSEPLARVLRERYRLPVEVIENGIDLDDQEGMPRKVRPDGRFSITYTGTIQGGRDPSALFLATRMLGERAERLRLVFYGRYLDNVRLLAEQHGVAHLVEVHEPVSYRHALKIQRDSDALLLLMWDRPEEEGVFTGKVFQYLGARRPILVIGPEHNVAARLLQERGAGVVLLEPEAIAAQLGRWLDQGQLPDLPMSVMDGLSRRERADQLVRFLSAPAASEGSWQTGVGSRGTR